jgi:hypothetical protein
MSRSTKPYSINVYKTDKGDFPVFLGIIHRHFEKSLPSVSNAREVTLVAPIDLLDMLVPAALLDKIDSLEITYRKSNGSA